jgi:outer membrane protein assembly factor BamA
MKQKNNFLIALLLLLAACSTTKHLPKNELLYTGIDKKIFLNKDIQDDRSNVMDEINAALDFPPNCALMGSSSIKHPFPVGLWIYNAYKNSKKSIGKWIFKHLASDPVLISDVNPKLRCKIASNLLHDYGYFRGQVTHEIKNQKNKKRKAKLNYTIDMNTLFRINSVDYKGFSLIADSLINNYQSNSFLLKEHPFSVLDLDAERKRITTLLRNHGFFYYQNDYISFKGDTIQRPEYISLQVEQIPQIPNLAKKQWVLGKTKIYLSKKENNSPNYKDSISVNDIQLLFDKSKKGKSPLRFDAIKRNIHFKEGNIYSLAEQQYTQQELNRMGIFHYTTFHYTPRDSSLNCDTLDLRINMVLDDPLEAELQFDVTSKSNNQIGPGATFKLTKKNIFRGGETFSLAFNGSYEWQTNSSVNRQSSIINSYEIGASATLKFPRFVFPWVSRKRFHYPTNSKFELKARRQNRAGLFNLISIGGNVEYSFQPSKHVKHSFTPFDLSYDLLQHETVEFKQIIAENPALYLSLKDQFIPAQSYKITYDDTKDRRIRHHIWWETSIKSAGNITSGIFALAGKSFNQKDKRLLGNPFAQFIKLTTDFRTYFQIRGKHQIVTRFMAGLLYAYGNSNVAPYSEQFYIGGANSIRAFTIRSIGPGTYFPSDTENKYNYINQTGDFKLEFNLEYRFPLFGNLNGALFLDAGNVWLVRDNATKPGGKFAWKDLPNNIALGTGAGFRYDLDFLVVRFDVGVALHTPYKTSKKGYYNIPRFKDGLGFHLAIGYPF